MNMQRREENAGFGGAVRSSGGMAMITMCSDLGWRARQSPRRKAPSATVPSGPREKRIAGLPCGLRRRLPQPTFCPDYRDRTVNTSMRKVGGVTAQRAGKHKGTTVAAT